MPGYVSGLQYVPSFVKQALPDQLIENLNASDGIELYARCHRVLEVSLSDGGLRAPELFDAVSPFGKGSWEIEFIGERNEIRGKPHG